MKLHEVAALRHQRTGETILDYQARLRDQKIKRLGSGIYATVYKHPSMDKIVVKVSDDYKQSAVVAWLQFAMKNQDNPYVPKIYDLRRFKTNERSASMYFIAFIERLNEYRPMSSKRKKALLYHNLGPVALSYTSGNVHHAWNAIGGDSDTYAELLLQHKQQGVPSKDLIEVLAFFMKHSNHLDLHDGNIMLRGKDQIVFTDPVE